MSTQALTQAKPASDNFMLLKRLLNSDEVRGRFADMLAERSGSFINSILSTVSSSADLSKCEPRSIVISAMRAASMDLAIEPALGYAYIVPFKDAAQLVIGYKGLIQLAMRTHAYTDLNAGYVYEGERVVVDRFTGRVKLAGEATGQKVIGYVAYFRMKDGYERWLYSTIEEVKVHASRYSKSYHNPRSPWQTDFDKMGLKTVLRALLTKWGRLSIDVLRYDGDEDIDLTDGADAVSFAGRQPDDEPVGSMVVDLPSDPFDNPNDEAEAAENREGVEAVKVLVDGGVCQNAYNARQLLVRYVPENLQDGSDPQALLLWGKIYRGWRDLGLQPADAAVKAKAGEVPHG